jgi:preprotein translocase subunit SecE
VSDSARAGASGADRIRRPAARSARGKEKSLGPFGRVARFIRQIIAELKKVVRPTRNELVNYASAVLVFVAVMMGFVTLVDLGVGSLTSLVFGG